MSQPDVSVIVIAHDVQPYIGRCLDSLAGQTLSSIETIVVESGSSDGTAQLADKFAEIYQGKIKVVHTPLLGVGNARNTGLALAHGKFIGFVDPDDWVEPEMFADLLERAETDGSDLVICDYDLLDHRQESEIIITIKHLLNDPRTALCHVEHRPGMEGDDSDEVKRDIIRNRTAAVWNKLFRRDLIENRRFPEDIVPEDIGFTVSCVADARRISHVDEALYHHESRPGSILDDMNHFRSDVCQFFESYRRCCLEMGTNCRELLCPLEDRTIEDLFNRKIELFHQIKDPFVRRGYALRWAEELNWTVRDWYEREPVEDWVAGMKPLKELVERYRTERIDESYDELVQRITSPPYRIAIGIVRLLRNLLRHSPI